MLTAPFPYFGGKARIAADVWAALGDVKHYIEPFFGSGAVLLARPDYRQDEHIETVCDKDGFVCNVWRVLQFAPDEVARWCDWPVNHADLQARNAKLLQNESRLLENLVADDRWHDPVMAGYWIWAASCWIGRGLTRPLKQVGGGLGTQIPHLTDGGKGVHRLGQRPHDADQSGNECPDVRAPYNTNLYVWFRELAQRLRYVRVVCGDWTRVCGGNWQDKMSLVGMFFDPPYGVADRNSKIYQHDSVDVAHQVAQWCAERGNRKTYRIVLAGYEEHSWLVDKHGWRVKRSKTAGGYANTQRNADSKAIGKANRERERLYLSPHCLKTNLFDT